MAPFCGSSWCGGRRRIHASILAAALLVIATTAQSLTGAAGFLRSPVPGFLREHPEWKLLSLGDLDDYARGDAEFRRAFTNEVTGDFNGDGVKDTVAVFVSRAAPLRFGVAVFHGKQGDGWGAPIWVRQDSEMIYSVKTLAPGFTAWTCINCDGGAVYGWIGGRYEEGLLAAGSEVFVCSPDKHPVEVFGTAALRARPVARLTAGTKVRVAAPVANLVGGKRWYGVTIASGRGAGTTVYIEGDRLCYSSE